MRHTILFTMAIIPSLAVAQVWCPPGAQWHDGFSYATSNGYNVRTYAGDSAVGGYNAQRISGESLWFTWDPTPQYHNNVLQDVFTRIENGILFIWHSQGGFYPPYWDTLAWFGAVPGDHWQVLEPEDFGCTCSYTVIDTGHISISSMSLRYVRTTTDCPWPGPAEPTFIERIGSVHGIFLDECQTGDPDTTLRCYEDVDMSYVTGIASACDLVVNMEEWGSTLPFTLTPDPANNALELRIVSPSPRALRLELLDASGRRHAAVVIPMGTSSHRISTTGLASGLHVARVCNADGSCWTVKWAKE